MNLSADQRKKIEENRAAALLKKKQFNQKTNSILTSNLTSSSNKINENINKNKITNNFFKKNVEKQETPYVNVTFSAINEDRFIADMNYHAPSIEVFKTIPGKLYGTC